MCSIYWSSLKTSKLVMLSGTYGLYIISVEKPFLSGEILVVAFANAYATTFLSIGT